jgi:hypothetical protein
MDFLAIYLWGIPLVMAALAVLGGFLEKDNTASVAVLGSILWPLTVTITVGFLLRWAFEAKA